MLELLLTKRPPVSHNKKAFSDTFFELADRSKSIDIATGYISADSVFEISDYLIKKKKPSINLMIGMHHFDGFTRTQYDAARFLSDFLTENSLGAVSISNVFPFHGKIYNFYDQSKSFASIIGSSNLTNLLKSNSNFECDVLIQDELKNNEVRDFLKSLYDKISIPFADWEVRPFNESNQLLKDHDNVEHVDQQHYKDVIERATRKNLSFHIPLSVGSKHTQSNLNVFFGAPRNRDKPIVKPRHWYEVELIVPTHIQRLPGYPEPKSEFNVITDDGWKFKCKLSGGDGRKNFRSKKDLKILGKWIKGKLENAGALKVGDSVTEETLKKYGRDSFELKATDDPNLWFLDFSIGD